MSERPSEQATVPPQDGEREGNGNLMLSRKGGESIVINGQIVVTVLKIQGNIVHFGFKAPREVPINRSEVQAAIEAERARKKARKSASTTPDQPAGAD